MSVTSLGMRLAGSDSMYFLARWADEMACLVIDTGDTHCEIQMKRAFVERLQDQLPATLAGLDRRAADTEACAKAGNAERRAVDVTARALDLAAAAEHAGDRQLAASLRDAAATASDQAKAVDDAVTRFEEATADADGAVDRLLHLLRKTEVTLRRSRDEDRPAGASALLGAGGQSA